MSAGDILFEYDSVSPALSWYLPAEGRLVEFNTEEIVKEARSANGTLLSDTIAVKQLITINYSLLHGDNLEKIVEFYEVQDDISVSVTDRLDNTKTYVMKFMPFSTTRLSIEDDWTWQNITIELKEV